MPGTNHTVTSLPYLQVTSKTADGEEGRDTQTLTSGDRRYNTSEAQATAAQTPGNTRPSVLSPWLLLNGTEPWHRHGIHTRKQVMVCLHTLGVTCAVLCAWRRSRCLITLQQQGRGCITWLSYFWTLENADCSFQSIFYKARNIKNMKKFPPSLYPTIWNHKSRVKSTTRSETLFDQQTTPCTPWTTVHHSNTPTAGTLIL